MSNPLFIVCEHGGRYNNFVRSLENRGAIQVVSISVLFERSIVRDPGRKNQETTPSGSKVKGLLILASLPAKYDSKIAIKKFSYN